MAVQTLSFPSQEAIKEVEQILLPQLVEDDPIFDIFPIVDSEEYRVRWEQQDNFTGLQQIRGLNGAPRMVQLKGANVYDYEPGVYGEYIEINEKDITERRKYGTFGDPVAIDDLVGLATKYLLQRRIDRIRYIIWTLLTTGSFAIPNNTGAVLHFDQFALKTLTASVPWSTSATAVPTQDIRSAQQLSVGQSVSFGADAEIWMNQVTANRLLSNTNANDFFGKRVGYGATVNKIADVNDILVGNNLPTIRIYDRFYLDDTGTAQKFIPNGIAVLIGKRTNNANLGEYRLVRNFNNDNMAPGAYTRVVDTADREVPRRIFVHDGHSGGPVIYFPGAIVLMTVG